ncbi:GGDEF domain-containing protein [Agrobacterium larrymoorei]|uniref:GGDEF domain-containing protein n=1 Tax=Agrobacterium larrymoorei TaxID=160699 RepID=UPI0004B24126|nr:GGDEF domain-containing protein [Agrobacterium larrymoorei]
MQNEDWTTPVLDTKTGMLLWSMEALTITAVLASLWLHNKRKKYHLCFAMGFFAIGLGSALVAMRGDIPDFLSIDIANTLTLSAASFWLAEILNLEKRPVEGWITIPALIWIAFMFVPPVRNDIQARIILYHCSAAVGYFMLAGVLLTSREYRSKTRKLLALAFVIQAFLGGIAASIVVSYNLATGQIAPLTIPVMLSGAFGFIVLLMMSVKVFMEDMERRLQKLAVTDYLTGALNRRGLAEEFKAFKARRRDGESHITLALFDIDHFKSINDKHGHQCGDEVLVQFCALANRIIGENGVFVRMGGEEFAYLVEASDPTRAIRIAEGIRIYFARLSTSAANGEFTSTVSVGLCSLPTAEADLDVMLTKSDRALYAAKKAGRNRTVMNDNEAHVVLPAEDRGEDPHDNNADRQVAALNRIASIANS